MLLCIRGSGFDRTHSIRTALHFGGIWRGYKKLISFTTFDKSIWQIKISTSWWCYRWVHRITEVLMIYPLGNMIVCTRFYGNPSCRPMVKPTACRPKCHAANMANKSIRLLAMQTWSPNYQPHKTNKCEGDVNSTPTLQIIEQKVAQVSIWGPVYKYRPVFWWPLHS